MRLWKHADIRDDGSGGRFNPFNYFENRAALWRRARNVRNFWLQVFVFTFVTNNGFKGSCDNELFLRFGVFEKKLQSIFISSNKRLFKPNDEGQRKVTSWTVGNPERESSKKRILIRNSTGKRKHGLTRNFFELRPILLPIKQTWRKIASF